MASLRVLAGIVVLVIVLAGLLVGFRLLQLLASGRRLPGLLPLQSPLLLLLLS
ncbi:MAG: hypothetical protein LM578_01680 [Desulfurococcaceae archaeon]|nr:hypothetical protein [Desulfurococcaceae archaeon]